MSWGAAMVASLLVILPRPTAWIIALAAFLVRGGLLLFLVPILVIPSPVGLATIVGPTLTAFWLGGMSLGFAAIVAGIFALFFAWLIVGGLVAAVTERELIGLVAADDELATTGAIPRLPPGRRRGRIWRIVIVRLAGHIPLAVALGYGSLRLVEATYRELTLPSDVLTPIAWRVLGAAPDAIAAIVLAWSLGEILGSLGARRLVLWGQSIDRAYIGAWADLLRRPVSTIATFVLPTIVLALVAGPIVLGAGLVWDALRVALAGQRPGDVLPIGLTTLAFVAIWSASLLVAGLVAAWRSAAWTVELVRTRGTFGGGTPQRPGEWTDPHPSGSV
jgi:hypothetical protein